MLADTPTLLCQTLVKLAQRQFAISRRAVREGAAGGGRVYARRRTSYSTAALKAA